MTNQTENTKPVDPLVSLIGEYHHDCNILIEEVKLLREKIVATKNSIISINDVALLEDLLFIFDRLYWNNDIGRRQAQERIDIIHSGKYGDKQGCYVQFKNVIGKLAQQQVNKL
jgi:hypothetical protein